jgi:hypothetical protein
MESIKETKQEASKYTHSLIASCVSGLTAGYAGFYFESTKKRIQSNQPVPNPFKQGLATWFKESFRGSGAFALCIMPPIMIQQVTSHYFNEKKISDTTTGKSLEALVSGAIGGVPSAIIGNILLEQQLKKIGPKQACLNLVRENSSRLLRGTSPLMIREAMFGFCYLKGIVDAGEYVKKEYGDKYILPAQIAIGIIGSLCSHPFDTMATTMQQFNYKTIKEAANHLWKENKVQAFYKGGASRIGLFTSTVLIIKEVREKVLNELEQTKATY